MGPERVVCAGWGQVCRAPFQLHESKLTAPYSSSSPGTMAILPRLSPASQQILGLLGEGKREPLFRETGNGDPSRLPYRGSVLKRRAPLSRLVPAHIRAGTQCPGRPAPLSAVSYG